MSIPHEPPNAARAHRVGRSFYRGGVWFALETATGVPVGQAGVLRQNINDCDETGLAHIIDKSCWRRGFASS